MERHHDARRSRRRRRTSARRRCSAPVVRRSSGGPAARTIVRSIGRSRRDRSPARSRSPTPTRRRPSSPRWSATSPTSWRCGCGRWAGSRARSRCGCAGPGSPSAAASADTGSSGGGAPRPQPNRLVRSVTLREATALDEDLRAAAASLLKVLWRRQPVGGLGLVLSNLQPTGPQMPLFPLAGPDGTRAHGRHAAGALGPSRAGRSALRLASASLPGYGSGGRRQRWTRSRTSAAERHRCRLRHRQDGLTVRGKLAHARFAEARAPRRRRPRRAKPGRGETAAILERALRPASERDHRARFPHAVRAARRDDPVGAVDRTRASTRSRRRSSRAIRIRSALAAATTAELEPQIKATGFFRQKAKMLLGMAQALRRAPRRRGARRHGRADGAARRRPQDRQRRARPRPRRARPAGRSPRPARRQPHRHRPGGRRPRRSRRSCARRCRASSGRSRPTR